MVWLKKITIAADIHDRIGYELVAQLKTLRRLMEDDLAPSVRREIERLAAAAERLISQSRSLIFELSPPVLKEVGLNPALEALAKSLLEPQGIEWGLRSRGKGMFTLERYVHVPPSGRFYSFLE